MDAEVLDKLEQSLADVLERFAFMFADPQSLAELCAPAATLCRTTLEFRGPTKGCVSLLAGEELGEQLAANILGLEPRMINSEAGDDAFTELLNIVCGEFLERFAGKEAVFDLSVPKLERLPASDWGKMLQDPACRGLLIDATPILIKMDFTCSQQSA